MKAHLTLAFGLLLICSGAVLAQTPDSLTPAEETVCDGQTGAAYGLCNAYCEAMDCESDSPQASATACTKVRDKFMNITGTDLPCEAPSCPCQSIPQFSALLLSAEACQDNNPYWGTTLGTINPINNIISGVASAPQPECGYISDETGDVFTLPITPEEVAGCIQVLHNAAANLGLTCN